MQAANYNSGTQIPLCAGFCNAWYSACAADYTCVNDWATWPTITINNATGYFCPLGSQCRTFAAVYGSGEQMCNAMWSPVYAYSTNTSAW